MQSRALANAPVSVLHCRVHASDVFCWHSVLLCRLLFYLSTSQRAHFFNLWHHILKMKHFVPANKIIQV
jgi:hypothetical protein